MDHEWPRCECGEPLVPSSAEWMACPKCPLGSRKCIARPDWATPDIYKAMAYPEAILLFRRPGRGSVYKIDGKDGYWLGGRGKINLNDSPHDRELILANDPSLTLARLWDSRGARVEYFRHVEPPLVMSKSELAWCAEKIVELASGDQPVTISDRGMVVGYGGATYGGVNLKDAIERARTGLK